MDKFFEILKKLRPGVQSGKITRERAKDILIQESGVSEELASKAADNMLATNPEVSGGITEVFFGPGDTRLGGKKRNLPEADNPSVEERTGGLLKEGKDYKIGEDGEYVSLRDQETGIDPDLAKLGDKDSFEYDMALYRQRRKQKMEKIYKQFGAVSETDKNFVDEYIDMDSEGNFVFSSSNPKYDKSSASIFIQESLQDIAGAEDIARNILYGRVAENIYADEGLEAYINYASKELKREGLEFNEQLLKKIMNRRRLAGGGRAGFKEGSGKKGILSALVNKLNEIAPGSTNVGKITKVSDKAKRREIERELLDDFNRFNKKYPTDQNNLSMDDPMGDLKKIVNQEGDTGLPKAGQGRFTKAEVLENIINNTIREFKDDPELGEYVTTALPNILKEIKAKPELANNENVFRNLTEQLINNPNQRIVVYADDTVDFFTKGEKGGMQGAKQIAEEFGISMEEAVKISTMEPEEQVLELTKMRRLRDKNRTLNAGGGLNYLMGL